MFAVTKGFLLGAEISISTGFVEPLLEIVLSIALGVVLGVIAAGFIARITDQEDIVYVQNVIIG